MTLPRPAARALVAMLAGVAVWYLARPGGGGGVEAAHGACFSALRLARHAVAAYEAQHGRLPGEPAEPGSSGAIGADTAALLVRQLTMPRSMDGMPNLAGPLPGLLDAIPVNPFTGLASIVVVPSGIDAVAFAAGARCGWAYLASPGADGAGPLPAGLLLPCGTTGRDSAGHRVASVQDIGFEIEDYERWR